MQKVIDKLGLKENEYIPYGHDKGKVDLSVLKRLENKEDGKLILVTALTPTKAGEGKTTVSIGLAQGLTKIGKKAVLALREPSLGPVFGMKGGATGGGVSSIHPIEDINLHFTGDLHAITSANNLLSALIDSHLFFGNELELDEVLWPRTMDMNDRNLRIIETKMRQDQFVITAASEVMAILALATSYNDLKKRLGNILVGYSKDKKPVLAKDLGAEEAMTILLKDAIKPNLVKTDDNVPAFVHAGPFANIAHGCNSILATKMALKLGEYAVTEAGFGADLGMEKFLHLKMPHLNHTVDAICFVVTIRALKLHGGLENYNEPNLEAMKKGIVNIEKHIENIESFGLPFVIALNHFYQDSDEEVNYLVNWAKENGYELSVSKGFAKGGEGTIDLAEKIVKAANKKSNFKRQYELDESIEEKMLKIVRNIYGANNIVLSKRAERKLKDIISNGWNLPVCMAKTQYSFSDDQNLVGRPENFDIHISDIRPSLGAGFIVAQTKGIMIMPGLNKTPRAYQMKIDDEGNITL